MHILYYEKLKTMRQVIKYLKDYVTPYNTFYLKDVGFVCNRVCGKGGSFAYTLPPQHPILKLIHL